MHLKDILLLIISILGGIGLLTGGLGYIISVFRKGSKQKDSELMSTAEQINIFYKTQNDDLKAIIASKDKIAMEREKEWNDKFQALTKEVGELKGQLNAEKAQNEKLENIFKDRDPDAQKFKEYVIKACENQSSMNEKIVKILSEIHAMAKAEHDRDFSIEATITKN